MPTLGPYKAPELYTHDEFDGRAVDIWACGIIYMAMRTVFYRRRPKVMLMKYMHNTLRTVAWRKDSR